MKASAARGIGILFRPDRQESIELAKNVVKSLQDKNHKCFGIRQQCQLIGIDEINEKSLDDIELFITIGGDGTYLNAVNLIQGRPIPILGTHLGHLGFLTETHSDRIFESINNFLAGKIKPEKRDLLNVEFTQKKEKREFLILNDFVIERGLGTRLIELSVFFDGNFITRFRADGLIVSTPTGSTAYNLSAGGPIIYPTVPAIVITPICPHSLTSRSLILPIDKTISIFLQNEDQGAYLSFDGKRGPQAFKSDSILIYKSEKYHLNVGSETLDYFERLNEKLKFGQR